MIKNNSKFTEMSTLVCKNFSIQNANKSKQIPAIVKTAKIDYCVNPKKSEEETIEYQKLLTLKRKDLISMLKCTFNS